VSFNDDGEILLQSRGHYLIGGDWPEFNLFKTWANTFQTQLFDILENRYLMYGEWMAAFHSVYYDMLPHFFMEFDVYDKEREVFLDTPSRHVITEKCEAKIESVRVITTDAFYTPEDLIACMGPSAFISATAIQELPYVAMKAGLTEGEIETILKLNDGTMEGLYIKWEEDGIVKDRYKYVRPDFVQTILDYGKHWTDRPTIPNRLAEGRDLFEMR